MKTYLLARVSLALFVGATPAYADVIELKTGQRVEGTLKQATPASVSVEVGGQTITFTGDKVRAIYFGVAPAPVTKSAAPPAADRFVLWETMLIQGRTRPTLKNIRVHDSREECDKSAARFTEGMKEAAQRSSTLLVYECLPVGVQPTP